MFVKVTANNFFRFKSRKIMKRIYNLHLKTRRTELIEQRDQKVKGVSSSWRMFNVVDSGSHRGLLVEWHL